MAADPRYDTHLDPAEFSPSPRLVKGAVALLALAAVVGLWKGANADRFVNPNPVPPSASAAASVLPAVGATSDTLIPPEALVEPVAVAPALARAAAPAPAALPFVESPSTPETAPQVVVSAPEPALDQPVAIQQPEPMAEEVLEPLAPEDLGPDA